MDAEGGGRDVDTSKLSEEISTYANDLITLQRIGLRGSCKMVVWAERVKALEEYIEDLECELRDRIIE